MGRDFKIIIPGGCNAKCSFCFAGPTKETIPTWIGKLTCALSDATPEFQELNITGGEPTASPFLIGAIGVIKKYKHKFPKVVMTTNGFKLEPEILEGVVDHLNISRHEVKDVDNIRIFGTMTVPTQQQLTYLISRCNNVGIDVSLSSTITRGFDEYSVYDMIQFAKDVGASALRIRKDYAQGLSPSSIEKFFAGIKPMHESQCPVCRVKTQLIGGMRVSWHTGVMEPSDTIKDDVYEIILQPNGKLTLDYAGNKPFSFAQVDSPGRHSHTKIDPEGPWCGQGLQRKGVGSCGSIGCGNYGC